MERPIDLLKYLPRYLQEYAEMYQIMIAENPEFNWVTSECGKVLNNTFIMYCDERGIQRFEKLLKIVAGENEPLEYRRSRIMVRWDDSVPYTLKTLMNKLIALQGNDDIQIILNGYTMTIITHMDDGYAVNSLKELFDEMIPCNMVVIHKNDILCNSTCTAYIAVATSYSRCMVNEYTQYFNSNGSIKVCAGVSSTEVIKIY